MGQYSLQDVKIYVTDGSYPQGMSRKEKKSMWKFAKNFCLVNEQLFYKQNRLVIFSDERKAETFNDCHTANYGGHMGINKTIIKITERFYWRNISSYVKDKISSCDKCQRFEKNQNSIRTLKSNSDNWNLGHPWFRPDWSFPRNS